MRIHRFVRLVGVLGVLSAVGLLGSVNASAAIVPDHGQSLAPAQPFLNNPDASDWVGSYLVGGQQTWGADFGYGAPDSAEAYSGGGTLVTKFGLPVDPSIAAQISYLLWRYGSTSSDDEAAAVEHLINSWLGAPSNPGQLDPANDFAHIAYDAPFHLAKLSAGAQTAVTTLRTEADSDQGPWTVPVAAPAGPQVQASPGAWTVKVLSAGSTTVPSVPVTITATDATLPNGTASQSFTTPADGSALTVAVTPTGAAPAITAHVSGPATAPAVLLPTRPIDQTLLVGASTPLTGSAASTAVPALHVTTTAIPPGQVGVAYSTQLQALGGSSSNHQWSVISGALPRGLTLAADGTLAGTPTTAGTATFTVQVDDPATATLTLTIAPAATTSTTMTPGPAGPTAIVTPSPIVAGPTVSGSSPVSSTAASTAVAAPVATQFSDPDVSAGDLATTGSDLREPTLLGAGAVLLGAGVVLLADSTRGRRRRSH
jgi:hypothetical protein